jgi:hypothetical protein
VTCRPKTTPWTAAYVAQFGAVLLLIDGRHPRAWLMPSVYEIDMDPIVTKLHPP